MAAARKGENAWRACASRGVGAGWRGAAGGLAVAGAGAEFRRPRSEERGRAHPEARLGDCDGEGSTGIAFRLVADRTMDDDARRTRVVYRAAHRDAAVGHVEPLVPSSWSVDGLSARV